MVPKPPYCRFLVSKLKPKHPCPKITIEIWFQAPNNVCHFLPERFPQTNSPSPMNVSFSTRVLLMLFSTQCVQFSCNKHLGCMERFAVTPCNDYLSMSLGGSEKNCWFQLDVSIWMLWSSSRESSFVYYAVSLGLITGGSEKNCWFQLVVPIRMLRSSSGESSFVLNDKLL